MAVGANEYRGGTVERADVARVVKVAGVDGEAVVIHVSERRLKHPNVFSSVIALLLTMPS